MYFDPTKFFPIDTPVKEQGPRPRHLPGSPRRAPRLPPRPRVPAWTPPRLPPRVPRVPGMVPAARFIPGVGLAVTVAGIAVALYEHYPFNNTNNAHKFLPQGWVECFDCGRRPNAPDYGNAQVPALTGWRGTGGSGCSLPCLSGQSAGSEGAMMAGPTETFTIGAGINGAYLQDTRTGSGITRARQDRQIVRKAGTANAGPRQFVFHRVSAAPMPNPNIVRALPFVPSPNIEPGVPTVPTPAPEPVPTNWQFSTTPPGAPPPPPHTRSAPRPREKHNKNMSTTKAFGIWAWKMLDNVAELTEIVASFYDALPADIRKAAKCGKGINIGQYGTAVNVCMLQTMYDHWDKIDAADAFMNLAKNVAEDMTIGQFHKMVDKFLPPDAGFDRTIALYGVNSLEAEAAIAGKLKELFAVLGLE